MIWCARMLVKAPIAYGLCMSQEMFDDILDQMEMVSEPYIEKENFAQVHFIRGKVRTRIVVCIRKTRKSREFIYAALVHEAVHVWQEFQRFLGEEKTGDEQEAYCIETISYNLMRSYKKQVGK